MSPYSTSASLHPCYTGYFKRHPLISILCIILFTFIFSSSTNTNLPHKLYFLTFSKIGTLNSTLFQILHLLKF